ncbi:MAG: STAS domain-containing protein [Deltaproteobacteria bacterium]|nr:STAS domain-containing protein [Deltaproteobacteria bacterium]
MALRVMSDEKTAGVYVVSPVGSLDTNTYSTLQQEVESLLQESPQVIIFDLKELNYISSSGVSVILRARKVMKSNEGEVLLVNMQPQIEKVFEIIKALPDQRIFKDIEELDSYLDRMQKKVIKEG